MTPPITDIAREATEDELARAQDHCMDCDALLIPCTCRPGCPGGMCSDEQCQIGELWKAGQRRLDRQALSALTKEPDHDA